MVEKILARYRFLHEIIVRPFSSSLRAFLFSRFIGVTLAIFLMVLGTATYFYDRLLSQQAQAAAEGIAAQTYTIINNLMPHGISREQLETVLDEIKAAHRDTPYQIEVYRSPLVSEIYGEIEQRIPFQATEKALAPGYGRKFTIENHTSTRHLYALTVEDQACLTCHPNAEIGSVLGIVEVKQSIRDMVARMRSDYLWVFVFYGGLAVALVVGITTLVINRVSSTVEDFRRKTQEIKTVTDLPAISRLSRAEVGFSELNEAFQAVGELAERLHDVAVDKDILEFEIKILNKFIITSNVVQDWQLFVKELLLDINNILDTYALLAFFQEGENEYELDVFWRATPSYETRNELEKLVQGQIYNQFQLASDSPAVRIVHHDCGSPVPLPKSLSLKDIELRTKSLFLDAPKVGGIVGIGVQSNMVMDSIYHIVLDSVLATLLNLVGSVKAIYKYTKDLEYYATRDPITQLHNQRMFWELLGYEVGRAQRHDYSFSLMVIDIDNFKTINDRYGHAFGDLFLQQLAEALRQAVRDGDFIARYGGDEFTVLLPTTTREQTISVAERIVKAISGMSVLTAEGIKVQATVSLGIAMFPEHGKSAKDLFLVADNMMYKVKGEGKNAIAEPEEAEITEIFKEESKTNFRVYQALEEKSIIPYFQPILDLATGEVEAHEVLMRIPADDGSMIAASDFIQAAGRIGLLHKLDHLLMEKTFAVVAKQNYQGRLFINLSPKSFIFPEFFPKIQKLSQEYNIDPHRVIFEVTERDTIRNVAMLKKFVTMMKAEGYRFAVDDFGSGYSSFKYLKLFPIDFLKIEGDFIRNILDDRDYMAYTKSIVTLARELGIKTVAEYVEDEKIINACRDLGVDYGQGYYIGRPAIGFSKLPARPADQQ
ncbi:putative bifunctional diguanylate cyclase/phosphodiesterase [Desulfurivibrio alkaliphilus]|uniref:Diguanylate cyclase/phosphodiesterase n=1 Tax=Desulfurivibrio alkaliphilus (strain DSM 19089 / UNIQEM U267 / AHT2) TaxID=589865 RepID=D6Z6H4_DESAT|nr:bifunctional diguanylate cyclase/phosphodiesterase [Desulfurivibrio alkaliphilus]ADH84933.1 diguanylate cyclase/phosphodiesterase [Desulfurivibrio alkaliphilus AHT 2]